MCVIHHNVKAALRWDRPKSSWHCLQGGKADFDGNLGYANSDCRRNRAERVVDLKRTANIELRGDQTYRSIRDEGQSTGMDDNAPGRASSAGMNGIGYGFPCGLASKADAVWIIQINRPHKRFGARLWILPEEF